MRHIYLIAAAIFIAFGCTPEDKGNDYRQEMAVTAASKLGTVKTVSCSEKTEGCDSFYNTCSLVVQIKGSLLLMIMQCDNDKCQVLSVAPVKDS